MDISIVVVSFNTAALLDRCLRSVLAAEDWRPTGGALLGPSPCPSGEVVVVDNGSADGSAALVYATFPWVRLIANQDNAGFARANNQGISVTSGDYVLLLNPDAELCPGAIRHLLTFAAGHPDAGVIGCQLLNPDGTLQPSGRGFPRLRTVWLDLLPVPAAWRRVSRCSVERRDYGHVALVDEVSGAAMLVRRAALAAAGGLDEAFFFLGEDVDLCWTLAAQGWRTYYLPDAQVVHQWGRSRAKSSALTISFHAQRGTRLLFKKHRRRPSAEVVRVTLVLVTVLKMVKGLVASAARRDWEAARGTLRLGLGELRWLEEH